MKKTFVFLSLLLACSMGYADSLDHLINRYKDKHGAEYRVVNVDSSLDELVASGVAKGNKRAAFVRGSLVMMGVKEVVSLKLDSCRLPVRSRFFGEVLDAIPESYSLLMEKGNSLMYMDNSDEEHAYLLVVSNSAEKPGLRRMYVTNAFVRAIMNDEGNGVDKEKFERYLERQADVLEQAVRGAGKSIEEGLRQLQERIEQYEDL